MDPQRQEQHDHSVLAAVRPAAWSQADAAAYEAVQRLLDEALEECRAQEAAALGAPVPDGREVERWQRVGVELTQARAGLRPDHHAAVRALRDRCLGLLDQIVRRERIRAALAAGRAVPLTPGCDQVRHDGVWWVRDGLAYEQASVELAAVLDGYALVLSAADAAANAEAGRGR